VDFNRFLNTSDIAHTMEELGATVAYNDTTSETGNWMPSLVSDEHVVVCQHAYGMLRAYTLAKKVASRATS